VGDEPRKLEVQAAVPLLENREQRRARERAQKKGLILPGQPVTQPQETQQPVDNDPRIGIGHVTDEHISHLFYSSMLGLLAYRAPMIRNRVLVAQGDAGHLDVGRNKVAQEFLKTGLNWLLWIDTDMAFQPREFDLLCDSVDANERPMVSGLYYTQGERRPVAFRNAFHPEDGMMHADAIEEPDEDGLVEVDGVGFGFVMVHRTLLERVSEEFGPAHPHRPWFDCSDFGPYQEPPSEDLSFCHRVRALGVPIYVHTGARVGHIKNFVMMGRRLDP